MLNSELILESIYDHFEKFKDSHLDELYLQECIIDKKIPEAVFNLMVVGDMLFKLNDGGVAEIFNYTDYFNIKIYFLSLYKVSPEIYTCLSPSLDYFTSVSDKELKEFYELGMFNQRDEVDKFYVRDKLNFLGKKYWRLDKKLGDYIQEYLEKNQAEIINFCKVNNLKFETQKDGEKSKSDILEELFEEKLRKMPKWKSSRPELPKIFHLEGKKLIWDLPAEELLKIEKVVISVDDKVEEVEVDFSHFQNLNFLQISGKGLKSFPNGLGCLKTLKILRLILSKVKNIDNLENDLKQLTNLENLEISNNKLQIFPDFICDLSGLKILNLSCNEITFLPKNINKLKKLEDLDLWYNKIETLPEEMAELTLLKKLKLSKNSINLIPDFIYNFVNLEILDFHFNEIYFISPNIEKLINLKELFLGENLLTDLPLEITNLKNIEFANVLMGNNLRDINPEIRIFLKSLEIRA
jgi:Leucine-rich repeat (LRR) protein